MGKLSKMPNTTIVKNAGILTAFATAYLYFFLGYLNIFEISQWWGIVVIYVFGFVFSRFYFKLMKFD